VAGGYLGGFNATVLKDEGMCGVKEGIVFLRLCCCRYGPHHLLTAIDFNSTDSGRNDVN